MSSLVLLRLQPPPLPQLPHRLRRFHRQNVSSDFSSSYARWHNSEAAESRADRKLSAKAPEDALKWDDDNFQAWRRKEAEILRDIEDIWCLTKEILHSNKYECGQRLSADDEKSVVERLLMYHSHREDKIGCGMDYIMVDQHPQFEKSRCLFVVRTDGSWIDFSYQKCLRSYIRDKYPSYAERFIKEHFKRSS